MARKIEVQIVGDSSNLARSFRQASASASGFNSSLGHVGSALFSVAKVAGLVVGGAALGGLALTLKAGISDWTESAKVTAQTEAVLKSTGDSANVTAGHVDALAQSILTKTGIDDEQIRSGENWLLTFKNVRNEMGAGNDVFDQATQAAVDLARAQANAKGGAINLAAANNRLGKALNDPLKGISALTRAGITFTAGQKDMIKALVASGHTLDAQKLILKEVTSQVGGSAEAFGKTLPGQISILREEFNNMAAELVGTMMPTFQRLLGGVANLFAKFNEAGTASAKARVVFDAITTGARDAGGALVSAIRGIDWGALGDTIKSGFQRAVNALTSVDWSAAAETFRQNALGVAASVDAELSAVDWGAVGKTIGDSVVAAITTALSATDGLPTAFLKAVDSIQWEQVGRKMGPGLAAAVASALATALDPAFWVKNWDLALALASVAFAGPIGRLGARLAPFFAKVAGDLVKVAADAIARFSPTLARAFELGLNALGAVAVRAFQTLARVIGAALGPIESLVRLLFGRLGGLAVFTLKVLGVRAAISAITGFGGKVIGALSDAGHWLVKAGKEIIDGLLKGLRGGWPAVLIFIAAIPTAIIAVFAGAGSWLLGAGGQVVQGFVRGFEGALRGALGLVAAAASKLKHAALSALGPFHSPPKWSVQAGEDIITGIGVGLTKGTPGAIAAANTASRRMLTEIAKLQTSIDAINKRREDEDQQSALRAATAALIAARKKGEGVAQAERDYQRAVEDIRVTAMQRELTAAQNQQAALQEQADKARERDRAAREKANEAIKTQQTNLHEALKAQQQKALDALQAQLDKARTKASASFDRLASLIRKAFDESTGDFVAPAQKAIDAINDRRAQQDLVSAVQSAKDALSEALQGDDPDAVLQAQRTLARAQEDIRVASLERQAEIETTAHDNMVAKQDDILTRSIETLRIKMTQKGTTVSKAMSGILEILEGFGENFKTAGATLGGYFGDELAKAIRAAVADANAVASTPRKTGGGGILDPFGVPHFAAGGIVTKPTLAMIGEAGPEAVVPLTMFRQSSPTGVVNNTSSPLVLNLTLNGVVGDHREVARVLAPALVDEINSANRVGRLRLATG